MMSVFLHWLVCIFIFCPAVVFCFLNGLNLFFHAVGYF